MVLNILSNGVKFIHGYSQNTSIKFIPWDHIQPLEFISPIVACGQSTIQYTIQ